MSRKFKLRPSPGEVDEVTTGGSRMIDRRDFIRHSFNSAAGVIAAASLGSIGFASLLMGTAETDGGDSAVRFWVPSGAEDTAWYGDLHLEPMTKSVFEAEAANSFPLLKLNFNELDKSLFAIIEKLSPDFASPFKVIDRPLMLKLFPL